MGICTYARGSGRHPLRDSSVTENVIGEQKVQAHSFTGQTALDLIPLSLFHSCAVMSRILTLSGLRMLSTQERAPLAPSILNSHHWPSCSLLLDVM